MKFSNSVKVIEIRSGLSKRPQTTGDFWFIVWLLHLYFWRQNKGVSSELKIVRMGFLLYSSIKEWYATRFWFHEEKKYLQLHSWHKNMSKSKLKIKVVWLSLRRRQLCPNVYFLYKMSIIFSPICGSKTRWTMYPWTTLKINLRKRAFKCKF